MTPVAETVWERGRFDQRNGPSQLLFGQMYEDAAIEMSAFRRGGRILCISSAGCTAMKLAGSHEVVALDINPVQLAYAESRLAGERCKQGVAERMMSAERALAPLVGWWPARLRTFLDLDSPSDQIEYWHQHLNTRRFRAAFDGLLSITMLRALYASSFLNFLPRRLGAVMRGRMERCFSRHPNRTNPYARALFLGDLPTEPPRETRAVEFIQSDAASYLERVRAGSFDGFSLSNILDGADESYRQRVMNGLRRAAAPGATVVLRSFREATAPIPSNRAAEDRSMLWGIVDVRPVSTL